MSIAVVTRDNKRYSFKPTTFQDLLDQVALKFNQPETEFTLLHAGRVLTALPPAGTVVQLHWNQRRVRVPTQLGTELAEAVGHPTRMAAALEKHGMEGVFPEPTVFRGPKGQVGTVHKGPLDGGKKTRRRHTARRRRVTRLRKSA